MTIEEQIEKALKGHAFPTDEVISYLTARLEERPIENTTFSALAVKLWRVKSFRDKLDAVRLLHPDARWVAMDEDKAVYLYETRPPQDVDSFVDMVYNYTAIRVRGLDGYAEDWRQSSIELPKGETK